MLQLTCDSMSKDSHKQDLDELHDGIDSAIPMSPNMMNKLGNKMVPDRYRNTDLHGVQAAMVNPGSATPHTVCTCRGGPAVGLPLNSTSLHIIRLEAWYLAVGPACTGTPSPLVAHLPHTFCLQSFIATTAASQCYDLEAVPG